MRTGARRSIARRTCLAAAVLVAAFVAGCGSSTQDLDSAKLESSIAGSILTEHGLHTTVQCPSHVPQQSGRRFTCVARLEAGTYPVTVTEIGKDGHVRYANERPLVTLDVAKVQRAIAASVLAQRHVHATVTCPSEVIQQAGVVFSCTAAIAGGSHRYPFEVSETDDAGHVRYLGT